MEEKDQVSQTNTPEPTPATEGRRLAPGQGLGRGAKIAIVTAAAVVAALLGGYLGLCAYAAGDRVIPGTHMGDVDLSGMTLAQAEERLQSAAAGWYDEMEVPIQVGGKTIRFSAREAGARVVGGADKAIREGKGNFLTGGWNYLRGLLGRETQLSWEVGLENSDYVSRVLREVSAAVDQPVEETAWTVEETEDAAQLILTRGRTGQAVDQKAVYDALLAALSSDGGEVAAQVSVTAPKEPDFDTMAKDVAREPADASLDVETDEVIPHQLGLKADPQRLKAAYDALAEGESVPVELEVSEPDLTTLELRAKLFRDILGEGSSKITGDANRVNNVILAAKACDGVVLLPGERMSYNQTTGQRTVAKGYREATGYTSKGQEMMVGGGVCQPSSTLYLACLNADLEIVDRKNHMYSVTYMPDGMDATVSWPNLDYVFANSTPYPIRVEMKVEKRVLTARIFGTKTDDTYVKMESKRLSTVPAETVYQADETVPQGTTTVIQPAHTGKKVEVYKCIYDGNDQLISRTLISTDTYRKTDKVIGYNPLDGVPGLIDPIVPSASPVDPTVVPTGPVVDPAATDPALPTQPAVDPAVSQAPADPAVSPEPTAEPGPAVPVEPEPGVLPAEPVPAPTPQGIPTE